jgi:hypothetical protein
MTHGHRSAVTFSPFDSDRGLSCPPSAVVSPSGGMGKRWKRPARKGP